MRINEEEAVEDWPVKYRVASNDCPMEEKALTITAA
jgi:hypothetical protein